MAGTREMRRRGQTFLLKFPNEPIDAYEVRLATATLFPSFGRTVSVMSGKPFARPVTLSDDTPKEIVEWAEDIDREGTNLHSFASEMMIEALAYGICGILVEAPKAVVPSIAGSVATKEDQTRAGVRPYFVRVKHNAILGWKLDEDGALSQLRLKEAAEVDDEGGFGTRTVDRVRVLQKGSWVLFEKQIGRDGKPAWNTVDNGQTGLDYVPFVPLYGKRTAFMTGSTPLQDLAYLNCKHWQSQSDQDTILHAARCPILLATGFEDRDAITVGSSTAIKTTNPAARMVWVEHSGAAIKAGADSLSGLEEQMVQAGAELLVKKPGARSATESAGDQEANKSDLQRITEVFENGLDQALQYMANYANLGDAGNLTLFKDFGASLLSDASGTLLLAAEEAEVISTETTLQELKRRGTISADIDGKEEAARVAAQPPKKRVKAAADSAAKAAAAAKPDPAPAPDKKPPVDPKPQA